MLESQKFLNQECFMSRKHLPVQTGKSIRNLDVVNVQKRVTEAISAG